MKYHPQRHIIICSAKKMVLAVVCVVLFVGLFASCGGRQSVAQRQADSLWLRAYRLRYTDVDSLSALLKRAVAVDADYSQGQARDKALAAYLQYQKMDYDGALRCCDSTYLMTDNQVTLLMADVLRMKVYQRIGDGGGFYQSRTMAEKHLHRIQEEVGDITGIDATCYVYAESEFHIISSTYYYYQEQDSLAKAEMRAINPDALIHRDTTQWLYYNYMMGSGGLVNGDYDNVALTEFGYLSECYVVARRADILYFEANALQSLATRLKTPYDRQIICQKYPEAMEWLMVQHLSWMPAGVEPSDSLLPMALARHALQCFNDYGDRFQSACVYRTMGELAFYNGCYAQALDDYGHALNLVNEHHLLYYPASKGLLYLYCPQQNGTIPIECRWMADKGVKTVPEWMAGIRQQISIAYSAIDSMPQCRYNRHIYLAILANTSQDKEMQSRMLELRHENVVQMHLLIAAALLLLFIVILAIGLFRRLRPHQFAETASKRFGDTLLRGDKERVERLMEELEEQQEACEKSRQHIIQYKNKNAERRAKVSLVDAIVPFLDRIISEVERICRQQKPEKAQLEYITELADRIVDYNAILTEWIKMQQGQLRLQIATLSLQPIFDIVAKGHFAYDQQGVQLNVLPTSTRVKADEALTLFMINTLSDNARKFTPRGGSVTVQAAETGEYVEISVTDTGCGMRQEDIDTILDNKVYDASKIGVTKTKDGIEMHGQKGFGFGLMNCKGIIEKYRKTSGIFSVCYFGIESKVGEGSRFFFRLPRVWLFIFAFITSLIPLSAKNGQRAAKVDTLAVVKSYYDKAVKCNEDSAYADALNYCDTALYLISPQLVIFNADNPSGTQSFEFEARRQHLPWDFHLLVGLRNQIAISALGLHYLDVYTYNNSICTQLHRHITLDPNLPTYCQDLAFKETASKQLTALLVVLSLLSMVMLYILLRSKRRVAQRLADKVQQKIEAQRDVLNHYRYEENRLYVRNQVLDNCLSTIKHESMYYPARIRQLAERMQDAPESDDLQQLKELTAYYKELYTLLSGQAESQTRITGLRREDVALADVINDIQHTFETMIKKQHRSISFSFSNDTGREDLQIRVDATLLHELFRQLFDYLLNAFPKMEMCALRISMRDLLLRISISSASIEFTPDQAHELFYPRMDNIPLLIVKQIIRDFDVLVGNPGLRLMAEENEIWFNLPQKNMV